MTNDLAAALEGLERLITTSSRDWGTYRVDAWLYAVLVGWDCEDTEHDQTCVHGALEEMAVRHGWDAATVAKARRYRDAVRAALAAPAEHRPAVSRWRVETLDNLAGEWAPGTGWPVRALAVERFDAMNAQAPRWKDGTPVTRRLVRETTTYTVEAETGPDAGARQDEPPTPSLRDQHRAAWHALTPDQQTARIAELDEPAAGARQDETCTNCNGSGLDPRYNGEFACPDCPAAGARQDGAET